MGILWSPAALWPELHPGPYPLSAFLVTFCAFKKSPAGGPVGPHVVARVPPLHGCQKKWFLVFRSQGRKPLAFSDFLCEQKGTRRQAMPGPRRRALPFSIHPLRPLRGHLPRPGGGDGAVKRNGVGGNRSQRRQPLEPPSVTLRVTAPPPGGKPGPQGRSP